METKRDVHDGYIRTESGGRLVIDTHATDDEHLRGAPTHAEQPLHRCRVYLNDLIPEDWRGRRGKVYVDRGVTRNGEVVSVQLSFVPSN